MNNLTKVSKMGTGGTYTSTYLLTIKLNTQLHVGGYTSQHDYSIALNIICSYWNLTAITKSFELDKNSQLHLHAIVEGKQLKLGDVNNYFRKLKNSMPIYKKYHFNVQVNNGQVWDSYLAKQNEEKVIVAYNWLTKTIKELYNSPDLKMAVAMLNAPTGWVELDKETEYYMKVFDITYKEARPAYGQPARLKQIKFLGFPNDESSCESVDFLSE